MFSLPYLTLMTILLVMAAAWEHYAEDSYVRTRLWVGAFSLFVLFFGFRGFVFYDWSSYYPAFNALPDLHTLLTIPYKYWNYEGGFMLLSVGCKTILNNYYFYVFFFTCINGVLLFRFLSRYTNNLPLALIIFISMDGLVLSTDLIRNSLAMFIILNGFVYIEKRRLCPYILICLLAFTIHKSALLYFPLYFVINRRWNKWIMLIIFLAANAVYVFHLPIMKELLVYVAGLFNRTVQLYIETYMKFGTPGSVLSIGYIERLVTGIMLFLYIDKLRSLRSTANMFINALFLYLTLKLALSEFSTISARVSMLFAFGYWVVWLDMAKCFTVANNRKLFYVFILAFCFIKVGLNTSGYLAEYENVIFPTKTYNERLHQFQEHFDD